MDNTLLESAEDICQAALAHARVCGATSSESSLSVDKGFNVTVRMGDVESLTHHVEQSLNITVYLNQKTGSASTTDLSEQAIKQASEKACNIAKFTQDDPCSGLAEKNSLATDIPDCDLDHPWNLSSEQAIEIVTQCEQAGLATDQRIENSEGASLNTNRSEKFYCNSLGFASGYRSTSHSLSCVLIAKENGSMQRDYDYTYARDAQDLVDPVSIGELAARRTVDRLGGRCLKTRSSPVIFRFNLASGLLSNLFSAISGSSIYRKSSFLLGQLDQQIFPDWVNITQQPHIPKAVASRPFDAEGVKTQIREIIVGGVLKSYILSSYSARKLNLHSTGNAGGMQNMIIEHSDCSLDELMGQMGTGLYVTELIGQGVNLLTGDYSRGAFGYWVENGKIQHPVEGITIAGNLKDMFKNIEAVANDTETRSSIRTGSLLINNMMIAGE